MEENLVKKTCKELGITQKELAEKIGVSPVSLTRWSKGKNNIPKSISMLLQLLTEKETETNINQELTNFKEDIIKLTKRVL